MATAVDQSNVQQRLRRFGARSTTWDVLKSIDNLSDKTILITGTNSGIGIETARSLAMKGAHVVMANRNIVQSQKLKDEIIFAKTDAKIDIINVDLSSLQSVRAAANEFIAKGWPLNVLILNAGVFGPMTKLTIDGYESAFGVNHLGHFYLTQLLLPKLRQSAPSRIVVVSSHSHAHTGINASLSTEDKIKRLIPSATTNEFGYRLYAYSKLCNVLFAFALNRREMANGIHVNVLHPGTNIATGISRSYGIFGKVFNTLTKPLTKSLEQGAATTVYCAVDPELDNIGGRYFESCWDDERNLQKNLAHDQQLQDALWQQSAALIKKFDQDSKI